jgi:hypothetical protein
MKNYLFHIKCRFKSSRAFEFIIAYHIHLVKKLLKIGFVQKTPNSLEKIDIVIPTISKDFVVLETLLASIKKHVLHPVNKFYIVSRDADEIKNFCIKNDCVLIDEISVLGYGKNTIEYKVGNLDRSGWIFQQLLKLSGDKFVEMDNYLIVDSDTIFINPHVFIDNGKYVFPQSSEWHEPYFVAFKKIFGYPVKSKLSYISHMMIMNTSKLIEMKKEIETTHLLSWDKVYLSTIDTKKGSCVSDYDTYANWILCKYPELVINRPSYNKGFRREKFNTLKNLEVKYNRYLNTISFHSYLSE